MSRYESIFWLHIKKAGGKTIKNLLKPHYRSHNHRQKGLCFIQADPLDYNDILNNYRMPLGGYERQRALFAKQWLYPNSWEKLYSFAFCRDPFDRCLSMFFYLYWHNSTFIKHIQSIVTRSVRYGHLHLTTHRAFDIFLSFVAESFVSDSIHLPIGAHFSTHVARMSDDISDESGSVLISKIYRLEDFVAGSAEALLTCGLKPDPERFMTVHYHKNTTSKSKDFKPTRKQQAVIEELYSSDFDIYHSLGQTEFDLIY